MVVNFEVIARERERERGVTESLPCSRQRQQPEFFKRNERFQKQ